MGTKSREAIYGASVRASAERATEARKAADRLACEAWNKRMLAFKGPAQPSPTLGDARNAGYPYLEVKCARTARKCAAIRISAHLVALRTTKISASDPPSHWWPGKR